MKHFQNLEIIYGEGLKSFTKVYHVKMKTWTMKIYGPLTECVIQITHNFRQSSNGQPYPLTSASISTVILSGLASCPFLKCELFQRPGIIFRDRFFSITKFKCFKRKRKEKQRWNFIQTMMNVMSRI